MKLIQRIKKFRHWLISSYWHARPINNNKIILWTNNFTAYGDNPKYVAEYLLKHYTGDYDIVWVFDRNAEIPSDMPKEIRSIRYFSTEYLKEIATAKVVICNARMKPYHYFDKRKGQYYIQTWHSSLRLKKIEGDAHTLSEYYITAAKKDSENIDLLISGCEFSTEIFKRAFWYDGEILKSGTPRCDGFFGDTSAVREKVYRHFGIDSSKKLVLYAPTFRENKSPELYGMDLGMLGRALGEAWVIGCRLHPNLNAEVDGDMCIPMSRYPDMQELLVACDLLITDYSSSMFDMAVAGKKCILYIPDLESYCSNERGLYFAPDELPFPKAENMGELCEIVKKLETVCDGYGAFLEKVGSYEDGQAAKRVCERIVRVCDITKNKRIIRGKI